MNAFAGTHGLAPPMQVLTLSLHGETFALDAHQVREILDPVPVTEVPGAAPCLGGLINVRGKIVPLLDLCMKLGMQPAPRTIDTRFIVVEVPVSGTPTIVGLRADRVFEMTEIASDAIEVAPQIGMRVRSSFVRCIGKRAGEFLVVLDMEAILRIERSGADMVSLRRHKRLKVSMPCRLAFAGQSFVARLADLSEGGAAIVGFTTRPLETAGRLTIDGVAENVPFRVVGFQDGILGVKFDESGHPAVSALVRRLESEAGHVA